MREPPSAAIVGVAFILFVGGVFALSTVDLQRTALEISVVDVHDPYETGHVTGITVEVRNRGDTSVDPASFSVIGRPENNYYWLANRSSIPPLAATRVRLDVEYARQALPAGKMFRVRVNDGTSPDRKAVSSLHPADICEPLVKDPRFHYWQYDTQTGIERPVFWSDTIWRRGFGPSGEFEYTKTNQTPAMTIHPPNRQDGEWAQASLTQSLDSLPRELTVEFATYSDATVWETREPHGFPTEMVGIRLADTTNQKRIWVAYSDTVDTRTTYHIDGPIEYVVIVSPDHEVTISPTQVYRDRGWTRDTGVSIHATVAAWPPNQNTTVTGGFRRIETARCR